MARRKIEIRRGTLCSVCPAASSAVCGSDNDFALDAVSQTFEQRQRLGNFRHLGRRRQAFERRREDRLSFGAS